MTSHNRARVLRRVKEEFARPSTPIREHLVRLAHRTLNVTETVLRTLFFPVGLMSGGRTTLFVMYDLSVNPITYDLGWTLAAAELERKKRKLRSIHFVFWLPDDWRGVFESDEYNKVIDSQQRKWRFYNIMLPMCRLVPAVEEVTVARGLFARRLLMAAAAWYAFPGASSRLFPQSMDARKVIFRQTVPEDVRCFEAPVRAVQYADQWLSNRLDGRKLVIITLRQSTYMPDRNSDLSSWAEFARSLDPKRYLVAIVPDSDETMAFDDRQFPGAEILREATFDACIRMAFYEKAWLNMAVNTGPLILCYFGDTRFVQVKKIVETVPQSSRQTLIEHGFSPGDQPPFLGSEQHIAWEAGDSLDDLKRAFEAANDRER